MRYKEYKKVDLPWLGEIPSHWEIKKFKRFTRNIGMGRTFLNANLLDYRSEETIPVYSATQSDKILGYTYDKSLLLKQGDIVIPARGNSIGYAKLIKENEATCSQTTIYCKIKDVDNKFLYYSCYGFKDNWFHFTDTAIPQITVKQVENNYVPIPPKEEQEQIARFLDWKINEIDILIFKKEEKLKILENYIKINIFKIFDDLNNEEIPLKRILSEKMTDGPHETPSFVDDGIPFVSVEAVENGKINLSKKRGFISRESSQIYRKKVKPQKDDIFIVKSGSTTGKIAYVNFDDEFDIWSPLALVRVKKNINKKYIFYYLSSDLFQQQIKDNWTFGTQPNIGMSTLINLKIKIPSKEEQDFLANNIETSMEKFENLKNNITRQINYLKLLKQSLISDVVAGKIDVRNVDIPNYEKVNDIEDDVILDGNFEEEV